MVANPKTLKDFILRTLGAPIVNVEVTEEQIFDCIQRTLDLFADYHYDGTNKSYAVFKLTKEEAQSGVLDLRDKHVFAVSKIIRSGKDVYYTFGGTPYNWFSDMVLSLSGSVGGCNAFFSPYSPMAGGMSYFTQLSSYMGMMRDQFDPLPDYWFNETAELLHISGTPLQEGDVVVCEVYTKAFSDVERTVSGRVGYGTIGTCDGPNSYVESYFNPDQSLSNFNIGGGTNESHQGVYNNRWVKEYSTALVKELNGYILSKHQGMQLPGGVTIDGTRMMDDARIDLQRLREELYLLDTPVPVIMG